MYKKVVLVTAQKLLLALAIGDFATTSHFSDSAFDRHIKMANSIAVFRF